MSEKFVKGWKVNPSKLQRLVGSKEETSKVLASTKKQTLSEVEDAVGGSKGKIVTFEALNDILKGTLDEKKYSKYVRMTELCLNHCGSELDGEIFLVATNYLPNPDLEWNPVLRYLELSKLSELWNRANLSFPWKDKPNKKSEWPVRTIISSADLPAVSSELESLTEDKVRSIPKEMLLENPDHDLNASYDELWDGLKCLKTWVKASLGASLVLIVDGDQ